VLICTVDSRGLLTLRLSLLAAQKEFAIMSFKITLEWNKNQSSCKAFLARSAVWTDLWLRNSKMGVR